MEINYIDSDFVKASFWLDRSFNLSQEQVMKFMQIVFRDMLIKGNCIHNGTISFGNQEYQPVLFRSLVTQAMETTDTFEYPNSEHFYLTCSQHPELYGLVLNDTMLLKYVPFEEFWIQRKAILTVQT